MSLQLAPIDACRSSRLALQQAARLEGKPSSYGRLRRLGLNRQKSAAYGRVWSGLVGLVGLVGRSGFVCGRHKMRAPKVWLRAWEAWHY